MFWVSLGWHLVVIVTACIGHPQLGCSRLEEVPEGTVLRLVFKGKPECVRKQKGSENMIVLSRIDTPCQPRCRL